MKKFFTFSLSAFIALVFTAISFGQPEPPMSLTHTPGDLNVSITNDGSIGHDTTFTLGVGVTWKGTDGCYAGGPLFGTSSRMSVNGNLDIWGWLYDIQNVSSNFLGGFTSDPDFDQITEAILDDGVATSPYDVEITQKTYSATGDEFVFIRYGFKNTTGSTLSNSVGGIFVDWDVPLWNNNSGGYALSENLVYQFGTVAPEYYFGLVSLDGASGMRVTPLGAPNEDSVRAMSYNFITTFDPFIAPNDDFRSWIGTSLGDIAAGETVWATFAVVAGDNLTQLNANALHANFKSYTIGWTNLLFSGIYTLAEPSPGDFGDIETNTSSQNLTIILSNWGVDDLIISNIATSVGPFTLESNHNYPITLSTADSVEVEIVFSPVAAGDYDEILVVTSNDPNFDGLLLSGHGFVINLALDKVMYASSGLQNEGNILSINKNSGEGTNIGPSSFNDILGLTISPLDKKLYAVRSSSSESQILKVNSLQGDSWVFYTLDLPNMAAISFDTLGTLYGALETGEIYSIDLTNGTYNYISTAQIEIVAITFEPMTNDLWATIKGGFGIPKDQIYKIDLSTGDTTFVGQTGLNNAATNDLAFDENGVLYGIKGTGIQVSDLFTIDVNTGEGTIIGPVGLKALTGLAYAKTGVTSVEDDNNLITKDFSLEQNYPNPFNPVTTIKYQIPELSFVTLKVYDVLGSEITTLVSEEKPFGSYEVNFNAASLPSGIYFYKLQAGSFVETKKMVLLR